VSGALNHVACASSEFSASTAQWRLAPTSNSHSPFRDDSKKYRPKLDHAAYRTFVQSLCSVNMATLVPILWSRSLTAHRSPFEPATHPSVTLTIMTTRTPHSEGQRNMVRWRAPVGGGGPLHRRSSRPERSRAHYKWARAATAQYTFSRSYTSRTIRNYLFGTGCLTTAFQALQLEHRGSQPGISQARISFI
jgi:hypothetical protein